ncbi:MAG: IS3 family transposase, partial [Pseudomonadota bacterium]
KTHEGWLYLAVVVDLYSRRVVGWSLQQRIKKELVLDALLMAVWRRKPRSTVTVHSDQGSQYTSHDWQHFLQANNMQASMSRRGNCHDNAVAESFFQLLKRERIKRHVYSTRDQARADVVDYIEMFYNSKRRHSFNNLLSPVEYENRFEKRLISV